MPGTFQGCESKRSENGSDFLSTTDHRGFDGNGVSVLLSKPDWAVVSANLSVSGEFSFPDLPSGTYQIIATASGYVPCQAEIIVEPGVQAVLSATQLVSGDVTDDSRIDLSDAVLIATNFEAPMLTNPTIDVNADGNLDILDLAQVGASYGLVGQARLIVN
jgi:hypothetical protein